MPLLICPKNRLYVGLIFKFVGFPWFIFVGLSCEQQLIAETFPIESPFDRRQFPYHNRQYPFDSRTFRMDNHRFENPGMQLSNPRMQVDNPRMEMDHIPLEDMESLENESDANYNRLYTNTLNFEEGDPLGQS